MTYYFKHKTENSYTMCGERNHAILSVDNNWLEITEAEYNALVNPPKTNEEIQEEHLAELRSKRTPLLEAFDKWEKAVLRGREEDDESVMEWYHNLLDLVESAFSNIPTRVQYYLGGIQND